MRQNPLKARLLAGETVFGCFVRYPDPTLAEFLGYTGWDFLMFDGEHGTLEPRDAENLVRSAELRGVTPIIRVPTNMPATILRLLDTGAAGVHVPWVNTAAEAEAAVRSIKYYPRGIRGLAGVRASDYGQAGSLADYVATANRETLTIIHVETAEAVEHLPEIAQIDGIDVLFIGPTDLSHSLGLPGQPNHPTVQETISRIIDIVSKTPKALGILAPTVQAAVHWKQRGIRYIATGLEAVVAPAIKSWLAEARG